MDIAPFCLPKPLRSHYVANDRFSPVSRGTWEARVDMPVMWGREEWTVVKVASGKTSGSARRLGGLVERVF